MINIVLDKIHDFLIELFFGEITNLPINHYMSYDIGDYDKDDYYNS